MSAWRCLFWVQSLLGSGHLRRALLVAEAIAARGARVTLVNGGLPGPWSARGDVEIVQLAPVVANGTDFAMLRQPDGSPVPPTLLAGRGERLRKLLAALEPEALVTEMFPFGRRGFRHELMPLLEAARSRRRPPVVAASVRDILVSKADPGRYDEMAELARTHYDRVLVHGDERLIPFAASFPLAATLGDRLVHTGFVRPPPPPAASSDDAAAPAVLVSAGGGAVGERLLRAAIEARPRTSLRHEPWLLVGGQNFPEAALAALAADLPPGCALVRYRPDLAVLMGRCRVSVSQAGYNTVVDGLSAGARMVLVPFAAGGEDEQTRRASRLAELGLAEMVAEDGLDADGLAPAIERMAGRPRPRSASWSFEGACRTAQILETLVEDRRHVA